MTDQWIGFIKTPDYIFGNFCAAHSYLPEEFDELIEFAYFHTALPSQIQIRIAGEPQTDYDDSSEAIKKRSISRKIRKNNLNIPTRIRNTICDFYKINYEQFLLMDFTKDIDLNDLDLMEEFNNIGVKTHNFIFLLFLGFSSKNIIKTLKSQHAKKASTTLRKIKSSTHRRIEA